MGMIIVEGKQTGRAGRVYLPASELVHLSSSDSNKHESIHTSASFLIRGHLHPLRGLKAIAGAVVHVEILRGSRVACRVRDAMKLRTKSTLFALIEG